MRIEIPNTSNVTRGNEAIEGMLKGIKVATGLIRTTYGPKGLNISVENEFYPFHQIANDAQTIIQAIQIEDPLQRRGLNFLKELMDKANKDSGDGRKTTCVIAEAIIEGAYKAGLSGIQFKNELDELIPLIEGDINSQKQEITEKDVHKVATIAGESKAIGAVLGEIYQKIGKDGVIIPESSGTYHTSYSIIEGVRFMDTGFLSPYMVHDEQALKEGRIEDKSVYEKPLILVTKRKINHLNDIDPLLKTMERAGLKDLVIFTDDMDSGVAATLVNTHKAKIMNILIIKAPVLWKNYIFEDFAKVVGATIVEDASGINFKNLSLNDLGTCGKITVDKNETVIVGGVDISEHIQALKSDGSDDSKLRLSWLSTKTAILKLGANNESELSYKRLKCYDAINASKLALRDGVVKGGGIALELASKILPDTLAGSILRNALLEPFHQLLYNDPNITIEDVEKDFGPDIIDSAAVIKNAVRNAISLASTVLTLGGDVRFPKKTAEQIAAESLQGRGLRF